MDWEPVNAIQYNLSSQIGSDLCHYTQLPFCHTGSPIVLQTLYPVVFAFVESPIVENNSE